MTLIDSLDSVVMLYSYAGFPERSFALFESPSRAPALPRIATPPNPAPGPSSGTLGMQVDEEDQDSSKPSKTSEKSTVIDVARAREGAVSSTDVDADEPGRRRVLRVKHNAMSNLSILLTIMSILVAFRCARLLPSHVRY